MSSLLLLWLGLGPGLALAQNPSAEVARLEGEMETLAQRNAWSGVDRKYQEALDVGVGLPGHMHWMAAQAALARGDMMSAWYRMERIEDVPVEEGDENPFQLAAAETAQLEERYGLVAVSVGKDRVAALTRAQMPFAQRERDAIGFARETIRVDRAFRGLLPVGTYQIDTTKFDVTSSWEWQVVVIEDE